MDITLKKRWGEAPIVFSCCFNFSSLLDIINLTEQVQWVKVNTNMTGYYIVHYADDDWAALINQLKRNPYVLSDKDRANLINNIFELAGYSMLDLHCGCHF